MTEKECCSILGDHLDTGQSWTTNVRKNGKAWIPTFLEYVDPEKCTGCGMCLKVCTGHCYELQERNGKKVSVAVHPENCLGDCSCHLICPVRGGAMVCKPQLKEEKK